MSVRCLASTVGVFTDRLRKSIQRDFFNYLIWWIRVRVRLWGVVRVWVRVRVGAMVRVWVGLVRG